MRYGRVRGKIARVLILALMPLWITTPSYGHPMGNFSINHYSRITIDGNSLQVEYFIDRAEIPTYQELQDAGLQANEQGAKLDAYLVRESEILKQGLLVEVDGKRVQLEGIRRNVIFPAGAGGLPTMKIGVVYRATLEGDSSQLHRLHFADNNFAGRAGWKEVITGSGQGATLVNTSVPQKDRSEQLSNYPTDLLNSPPQDLEANLTFHLPSTTLQAGSIMTLSTVATNQQSTLHPGKTRVSASSASHASMPQKRATPAPALQSETQLPVVTDTNKIKLSANRQATPRSAFTELITRQNLGLWFLLTAAFIAMALGGLHALEPGHGKTLVAAYLVGSRGKAHHAVLLGTIVTLAHTAGVYALGFITLFASRYIVPEKLYPWLGVISGLTVTGLALLLFLRRWNEGGMDENHTHWYERFTKPADPSRIIGGTLPQDSKKAISLPQLLVLGITGGLVPCPAALVVLLSAFSLHRVGFGLFLIVCFSVGLAAVLVSIGLMMVYAGRLMKRFKSEGKLVTVWLPLISSVFMMMLGLALTMQSFRTTDLAATMTHMFDGRFLLLLLLGIFLGMRHSTDADHVVAVTTIVTRMRSLRQASMVGLLWGVGHTLTIFIVGSAIILFGVVIPARLGLTMEFCVALMLILLGILNLTGVMRLINNRFTKMRPREDFAPASTISGGTEIKSISPAIALMSLAPYGMKPALATAPAIDIPECSGEKPKGGILALYQQFGSYQLIRPLIIGTVHGLAGSAAVALLVLATIKNPAWAIAYLLLFGAGTVLGMMAMTALIAAPIIWSGNRFNQNITRYMATASGVVSLVFGIVLAFQIGYIDGLFRAVPSWTPH